MHIIFPFLICFTYCSPLLQGDVATTMTCVGINIYETALWCCSNCLSDSVEFTEIKNRVRGDVDRLKSKRGPLGSDFKVVTSATRGRLVLVPTCMAENHCEVDGVIPNPSTALLLPAQPPAIKSIMTLCDEAAEVDAELKQLAEELLKRPFVSNFEETMSCLYRSLLANVRFSMGKILRGLSSVTKGEILSLNPNITSATKRNPNLGLTVYGALREVCSWSTPFEDQRSAQSAARSNINGRVKMYVKGTILDGFEDEHLNRIMLEACRAFVNPWVTSVEEIKADPGKDAFLIKILPVVLKYIHTKVQLLVKHIVAPNFEHYDLRLKFGDNQFKVELEGYVYARQFDEVNRRISEDPEIKLLPEVLAEVLQHGDVLPTATLDWKELSDLYAIEEMRARTITQVVQQCQYQESVSPLSLLNIWTPCEWTTTDKEKELKAQVLELSRERSANEDTLHAISYITEKLRADGLFEELVTENIEHCAILHMKEELTRQFPLEEQVSINALVWYHTLLLKTGGSNQWTLRRKCGETQVTPYHPLLLEALQNRVEVRVALTSEHLEVKSGEDAAGVEEGLLGWSWKQVSILEFLHGLSQASYKEPTSQATISIKASQEHERCFRRSNENDEEVDDIFINRKNESFIIINGDMRKLYSKRPPGAEEMTFAHFVISYYKKNPHQKATINPDTDLGADSGEAVVGGQGRMPTCMKLSNKVILKKRSQESRPVPLLLGSNSLDSYGERLLFQPWRQLEELSEESTEDQKYVQKQNRLALFPMSIFPMCENSPEGAGKTMGGYIIEFLFVVVLGSSDGDSSMTDEGDEH